MGALALLLPTAVPIASAQCADPRGNAYCTNGGQVTFTQPQPQPKPPTQAPTQSTTGGSPATSGNTTSTTNPALQTNPVLNPAASSSPASISIDPPAAPFGAQITVAGQGLGANRAVWVNLTGLKTMQGLAYGAQQLATPDGSSPKTGPDGSLSVTLVVPELPNYVAGDANICVLQATPQPVCAPFTIQGAGADFINSATSPSDIVGHYECSSAVLIGFGGGWCLGTEPVLTLSDDGTYSWGDEQGSWDYDGNTVTFSGSLGSGTVVNRKLTVDTQVPMPDGSIAQVRIIYLRMDY